MSSPNLDVNEKTICPNGHEGTYGWMDTRCQVNSVGSKPAANWIYKCKVCGAVILSKKRDELLGNHY